VSNSGKILLKLQEQTTQNKEKIAIASNKVPNLPCQSGQEH